MIYRDKLGQIARSKTRKKKYEILKVFWDAWITDYKALVKKKKMLRYM